MAFGNGNGNTTSVEEELVILGTNQKDSYFYKEMTPGGALAPRGFHLNGLTLEPFNNDFQTKVIERAQATFDSIVTRGKGKSDGSGNGGACAYDLAFLLQSAIGKVTPSIPLHTGSYVLDTFGATGGSFAIRFTLEDGSLVTTALILFNDTDVIIESKINAALGRGASIVNKSDTTRYEVELQAEFALAIVISATIVSNTLAGGTGVAIFVSPSGVGTGWYRFIWDLRGYTGYQTYAVLQGPPDDPLKARIVKRLTFSSIGMTTSDSEATMTTNFYANTSESRNTIESGEFDDIIQEVLHPAYWRTFIGKEKFGVMAPVESCGAFSTTWSVEGLRQPVMTKCGKSKSFITSSTRKPSSTANVTIAESEESNEIQDIMEDGGGYIYVAETYTAPVDDTGFGIKAAICFPLLLEKDSQTDVNGSAAINFSGRMGLGTNASPRVILWLKTAAV